ncbi:MAG TPA: transketolase [Gaiellaceae bacterium]|nr:transketolase [Gaiellaceae bacterium]
MPDAATISSDAATTAELDQLCINTIRTLSIDAVQAAQSGHPGAPLALAPTAYLLYTRIMKHNPADPTWADRDRLVLSAGHASMLLYASLHLAGYHLSLDQIKLFRQLGSETPGHPEYGDTPGVETTTGPLGQGVGNAVGMAMAEEFLRQRYGTDACDHHVFAICSDGDLMEGVASEAASLAGHLGLGRLVMLYDDNKITIDGPTELSFAGEDVPKRFEAYGWHTLTVEDGNDLEAIEAAIRAGIAETGRPTLISLKTVIGFGSPRAGTRKAHSDPMPDEDVRATKEALGWDPDALFFVPDEVYAHWREPSLLKGAAAQAEWSTRFEAWASANADLAAELRNAWAGKPQPGFGTSIPVFETGRAVSTRVAGSEVMQAFGPFVPTMVGGAADLVHSTFTHFESDSAFGPGQSGRNVSWGVREHGMGAAINGLALHGGILKPFGSTFFVFTDYMRPPIRLSSLMKLDAVWIFSHDSVAVGEDGPTHQPVEHLAAMRAIPGLTVIRPADANETAEAWRVIVEELEGPACLVLSRQNVPTLDRETYAPAAGLARGAYVLAGVDNPAAVLVATGAEVATALSARDLLAEKGIAISVVSMPSWELFEAQPASYRDEVLPAGIPKVSVEAGSSFGWAKWVDHSVSIDTFGASGPGGKVLTHFGISPENIALRVEEVI